MTFALSTHNLHKAFGGIVATNDVSINVEKGARHALIGPNGAGKTTLINLLTGVLAPTAGRIELDGQDITKVPQHGRVRRGLVRTFQINQLFKDLTPLETIAIAIAEHRGIGASPWRAMGANTDVVAQAEALLERFGLADARATRTAILPYGKQRLLEIALAFASEPTVLLLDEPAAGVPQEDRREILDRIDALPPDVTVLLIEHDMDLVFTFARRISVLVNGALLVEGARDEIARDPRVREVYLGEEAVPHSGAKDG